MLLTLIERRFLNILGKAHGLSLLFFTLGSAGPLENAPATASHMDGTKEASDLDGPGTLEEGETLRITHAGENDESGMGCLEKRGYKVHTTIPLMPFIWDWRAQDPPLSPIHIHCSTYFPLSFQRFRFPQPHTPFLPRLFLEF